MERKFIENLNANLRQIQTKLKEIFRPMKFSSAKFVVAPSMSELAFAVENIKQNAALKTGEYRKNIKQFSTTTENRKFINNEFVKNSVKTISVENLKSGEQVADVANERSVGTNIIRPLFSKNISNKNMFSLKQKINTFISETNLKNFAPVLSSSQKNSFLENSLPANVTLGKILLSQQYTQISEQKMLSEKENIYTAKEKDRYNPAKRSENILQVKNNIYIDGELHKAETSTKRAGN